MTGSSAHVISKSRFVSGLQCPKKLWTEVHARQLIPEPGAAIQARFDQGHDVGSLARQLFPGGIEIGPGVRRWDRVVEDTRRALTQRRPLYEAAFRAGNSGCRVDILVPLEDEHWDVFEVKSSTSVKDVHYADLAFQAHVLETSGLLVRDYYVVHIDTAYLRDGDLDLDAFFRSERVTELVRQRRAEVQVQLEEMAEVLSKPSKPEIAIGSHCRSPYTCPLITACWSFLPPDSVFDLTGIGSRAFDLVGQGVTALVEVPATFDLGDRQRIQLEAVRSKRPHVDREALRTFLSRLIYPIYYFDLETFAPAIPRYDFSRPYQQIPFLFSIHKVEHPGEEARHYVYLFDGQGDPRRDVLRAARVSLESEGSIVAYNAPFERRVLCESAAAVLPELEEWAHSLEGRFVDLLTPFRSFSFYHPLQKGSASLKAVLSPVTGLSYDDLEIADGEMASTEYLRAVSGGIEPIERARILSRLQEYCSLDTHGMVEIVRQLERLIA